MGDMEIEIPGTKDLAPLAMAKPWPGHRHDMSHWKFKEIIGKAKKTLRNYSKRFKNIEWKSLVLILDSGATKLFKLEQVEYKTTR